MRLAAILSCCGLLGLASACGGNESVETAPPSTAAPGSASGAAATAGSGAPSAGAAAGSARPSEAPAGSAAALPPVEFSESEFVEADESRDPFRSFAELFLESAAKVVPRQVKVRAAQYALDELKLSGVVTRGEARALLTDPAGLGWIVRMGEYVGKPELVSTGGTAGLDVALNWRIDRIRESDVVFLREDPAHSEIAPAYKVMYLHPLENEEQAYKP